MATDTGKRTSPATKLDSFLEQELSGTARRMRWADTGSGMLAAAATLLAGLFVLVLADTWLVPLGSGWRAAGLAAVLAAALGWIAVRVFPALVRRMNPQFVARSIERSGTGFHNSLLNWLQIRDRNELARGQIPEALARRAATDIAALDEERRVDFSAVIRLGLVVAALVGLFVAYILLSPRNPWTSITRIIAPWSRTAPASSVTISDVQPGDAELFYGEKLNISCSVRARRMPAEVRLVYSSLDGQLQDVPVIMEPANGRFAAILSTGTGGINADLRYRIEAGDGRSPEFTVRVRPNPAISVQAVTIEPPAYTGLPVVHQEGRGEIRGVEGSRIRVRATTNQDIRVAWLELVRLPPGAMPAAGAELPVAQNVNLTSTSPREAVGEFLLLMAPGRAQPAFTHYRLRFRSTLDQRSESASLFPVQIIPDAAPEVRIVRPDQGRISLPVNASLAVEIHASDTDYAISRVSVKIDRRGVELREQELELPREGTLQQVDCRWLLQPARLGLQPGDEICLRARALDNRIAPVSHAPEPNETLSDPRWIRITDQDPALGQQPPEQPPRGPGQQGAQQTGSEGSAGQDQSPPQHGDSTDNAAGSSGNNQQSAESGSNPEQQSPAANDRTSGSGSENSNSGNDASGNRSGENGSAQSGEGEQGNSAGQSGNEQQDGSSGASGQPESGNSGMGQQDGNSPDQTGESGTANGSEGGQPSGDQGSQGRQEGSERGSGDGNGSGAGAGASERSERPDSGGQSGADQARSGRDGSGNSGSGNMGAADGSGNSQPQPEGQAGSGQPGPDGERSGSGSGDATGGSSAGSGQGAPDAAMDRGNPTSGNGGGGQRDRSLKDGQREPLGSGATDGEVFDEIQRYLDEQSGQPSSQSGSGSGQQSSPSDQSGDSASSPSAGSGRDGEAGGESRGLNSGSDRERGRSDSNPDATGQVNQTGNDPGAAGREADPGTGQSGGRNGSDGSPDRQGNQAGDSRTGDSSPGDNRQSSGNEASDRTARSGEPSSGQSGEQGRESGRPEDRGPPGQNDSRGQSDPPGQDGGDSQSRPDGTGNPNQQGSEPPGSNPDSSGESGNPDPAAAGSNARPDQPGGDTSGGVSQQGSQPSGSAPGTQGANSGTPGGSGGGGGRGMQPGTAPINTGDLPHAQQQQTEYSRSATDLVLESLEQQKDRPDPNLLNRLGWTEAEFRDFLRRWQEMKRAAAAGDPSAVKRYTDALRSLGLRPRGAQLDTVRNSGVESGGLSEDGGVNRPPPALAPEFNAFLKSRSRADQQSGQR